MQSMLMDLGGVERASSTRDRLRRCQWTTRYVELRCLSLQDMTKTGRVQIRLELVRPFDEGQAVARHRRVGAMCSRKNQRLRAVRCGKQRSWCVPSSRSISSPSCARERCSAVQFQSDLWCTIWQVRRSIRAEAHRCRQQQRRQAAARTCDGKNNVLICKVGGGVFDGSLSIIEDGTFELRATPGDDHFHEKEGFR